MTTTTPARVDDDSYDVTRSVLIRTSRHRVWGALTVPELISEWFGDRVTFDRLELGARGTYGWDGYGEFPVEIVEWEELSVFAFRWGRSPDSDLAPDSSTVVRFTLADVPEGTLLTVVESGFRMLAGDEDAQRTVADENREGWDGELDELVAFLEKQDSQ